MSEKVKYQLEYIIKASDKMLFNSISTPSGLSEWFCNDVNIRGEQYTFFWDDSEEAATLLSKKQNEKVRFQWEDDEGESVYFEMAIRIDGMTKEVALIVTDFAEEDELEEAKLLWDNQINDLKQKIGG